jgi:hypothetical protein
MKSKGVLFYGILFCATVLLQGLLFDQIEPGWGIHIMVYPMFILLLPFEIRPVNLLFISFLLGICIDFFTNSFGLHASCAVFLAYFRNQVYKRFEPRDGYESSLLPSINEMKRSWFIRAYGLSLLMHHFIFFSLEIFKFSQILFVFQKTILSSIASFFAILLIQQLFLTRAKQT